eukprot:223714-Rhodomonas_salina.1
MGWRCRGTGTWCCCGTRLAGWCRCSRRRARWSGWSEGARGWRLAWPTAACSSSKSELPRQGDSPADSAWPGLPVLEALVVTPGVLRNWSASLATSDQLVLLLRLVY